MKKTLITLVLALLTSLSVGAVGCQQTNPDKSSSSISSQNSSSSEISSSQESSSSSIEESSSSIEDSSSEESSSSIEDTSSEETSSSTEDSSSSEENNSSQQSKFTVTWVIDEFNQTDTEVDYGCAPTYPDATPTKPATQESKFTFAGWSLSEGGEVVDLTNQTITTEGVIYYAVFTSTPQQYTITWAEETSASDQTLDYGTQITAPMVNPTKVLSDEHSTTTFEFAGWADKDGNLVTDFGTVSQDVTYYAVFDNATSVWKGTIPTIDTNATEDTLFEKDTSGNYLIQTATDLAKLSAFTKGKDYGVGISYKLTANIDLSVGGWLSICNNNDVQGDWATAYCFKSNFDGNNHTITYNETNAGCCFGLFSNVADCSIKNITFNGSITGSHYLAPLTVRIWGNTTLENITNNANITATNTTDAHARTAGIVCQTSGPNNSLINCHNNGNITANTQHTRVGGLIGRVESATTVTNCSNTGTIKGKATANSIYGNTQTYIGYYFGEYMINTKVNWVVNGATTTNEIIIGGTPSYTPSIEDDEFRYIFVGWSLAEGGEVITLNPIMKEETYYAIFEKVNLYSINFVVEEETTTFKGVIGEKPIFEGTPEKEGFLFVGWSDGTNTYAADNLPVISKAVTYTAVFQEVTEKFTIEWNIDGVTTTEEVKYGSTPTHENPVKDGYLFLGWSTSEDGYIISLSSQVVKTDVEYFAVFEKADMTQAEFMSLPVHWGSSNNPAWSSRARIDFSFKLKAGAKFTFIGTAEQLAFYKWTVNEESTNINSFSANNNNDIDAGWNTSPNATYGNGWKNGGTEYSTTQYTTQSECYPIIVFMRTDGSAFTASDLSTLKTLIKVEGTKATMYNNGTLTEEEYKNQPVGLGSYSWTTTNTRARIMLSVRMAAGTKITFKGDTSVYGWAVVETGTHNYYKATSDTDERITSKCLDSGWISGTTYYSQIDGAYLVLTLKKLSTTANTFADADLKGDALHNLFTVEGTKRVTYDPSVQVDYDIKSINHRGQNYLAPENTLEAYKLSALAGFKYVECDISFTKDGIPVLLHDDTIDRTSNGTGAIKDLTLAEARQYDYGSWFSPEWAGVQIPTLEEFLMLCKEYNLHPYIEIKWGTFNSATDAKVVVDLVEKCGMTGNVSYISFNPVELGYVKEVDASARLGCVISSTVAQDHINKALALKTDTNEVFIDVYVSQGATGHNTVTLCQSAGIPLEVWTADGAKIDTLDPYVSGVSSEYTIAGRYLENKTTT